MKTNSLPSFQSTADSDLVWKTTVRLTVVRSSQVIYCQIQSYVHQLVLYWMDIVDYSMRCTVYSFPIPKAFSFNCLMILTRKYILQKLSVFRCSFQISLCQQFRNHFSLYTSVSIDNFSLPIGNSRAYNGFFMSAKLRYYVNANAAHVKQRKRLADWPLISHYQSCVWNSWVFWNWTATHHIWHTLQSCYFGTHQKL